MKLFALRMEIKHSAKLKFMVDALEKWLKNFPPLHLSCEAEETNFLFFLFQT